VPKPGVSLANRLRFGLAACAAVLLAACATHPDVRTGVASDVDFAAFETFAFVENPSLRRAGYRELVTGQVMFSVQREFEVRGLRYVADRGEADLLVNFNAHVSERARARNTPPSEDWTGPNYWNHRMGAYRPWPAHRGWPVHQSLKVQRVTFGTLSVDVVDARRNVLVWEGAVDRQLTQDTLNALGPAIDAAIHRIFRDFPVRPEL